MKRLEVLLKGAWIGGTMTVPGVSGGTMAILLGIYDRLIGAVSALVPDINNPGKENGTKAAGRTAFFLRVRKSLLFLTVFLLGAGCGMLAFAKLISGLLEQPVTGSYVRFFFLGAVAGGIPLIFRSAGVKRFSVWLVALPVIGAGLVYALSLLPEEMFSLSAAGGPGTLVLKLTGGVVLAIALVLPGISASQMLFTLGIYEELLLCVGELRIIPLIPLGIGAGLGILLITKTLDMLMTKHPKQTFLIIIGFILGSLPELFPGNVKGNYLLCAVFAVIGFFVTYLISTREAK